MTKTQDDLDAVRAVVDAVQGFDAPSQERIFRWAREKLGLQNPLPLSLPETGRQPDPSGTGAGHLGAQPPGAKDIKSFIAAKNPKSDNQFAAVVAYYHRFEAPLSERKQSVTAEDLQEATRKAGRDRLKRPIKTLHSAHRIGLLDKAGRGQFSVNTVGENLVAMTLPQANGKASPKGSRKRAKKAPNKAKTASKKKARRRR